MNPTTKNGWQPGNPIGMRAALERPWGYQALNGNRTAEFCPMCNAMIPYETDSAPKQVHIDFHITLAAAIDDARAEEHRP